MARLERTCLVLFSTITGAACGNNRHEQSYLSSTVRGRGSKGSGPRPEGYYDLRAICLVRSHGDDIGADGLSTLGVIGIYMPEVVNIFDRAR